MGGGASITYGQDQQIDLNNLQAVVTEIFESCKNEHGLVSIDSLVKAVEAKRALKESDNVISADDAVCASVVADSKSSPQQVATRVSHSNDSKDEKADIANGDNKEEDAKSGAETVVKAAAAAAADEDDNDPDAMVSSHIPDVILDSDVVQGVSEIFPHEERRKHHLPSVHSSAGGGGFGDNDAEIDSVSEKQGESDKVISLPERIGFKGSSGKSNFSRDAVSIRSQSMTMRHKSVRLTLPKESEVKDHFASSEDVITALESITEKVDLTDSQSKERMRLVPEVTRILNSITKLCRDSGKMNSTHQSAFTSIESFWLNLAVVFEAYESSTSIALYGLTALCYLTRFDDSFNSKNVGNIENIARSGLCEVIVRLIDINAIPIPVEETSAGAGGDGNGKLISLFGAASSSPSSSETDANLCLAVAQAGFTLIRNIALENCVDLNEAGVCEVLVDIISFHTGIQVPELQNDEPLVQTKHDLHPANNNNRLLQSHSNKNSIPAPAPILGVLDASGKNSNPTVASTGGIGSSFSRIFTSLTSLTGSSGSKEASDKPKEISVSIRGKAKERQSARIVRKNSSSGLSGVHSEGRAASGRSTLSLRRPTAKKSILLPDNNSRIPSNSSREFDGPDQLNNGLALKTFAEFVSFVELAVVAIIPLTYDLNTNINMGKAGMCSVMTDLLKIQKGLGDMGFHRVEGTSADDAASALPPSKPPLSNAKSFKVVNDAGAVALPILILQGIVNIADNEGNTVLFGDYGAYSLVIQLLEQHLDSSAQEFFELGMQALSYLSHTKYNHRDLGNMQAARVISSVLQRHALSHTTIAERGLEVVLNLSVDEQASKNLYLAGACRPIVKILETHGGGGEDDKIAEYAFRSIINLSAHNATINNAFGNVDACKVIVATMISRTKKVHKPGTSAFFVWFLRATVNLSSSSDENKQKLCDAGISFCLTFMMDAHGTSHGSNAASEWTMKAVVNLANEERVCGDLGRAGLCENIISLLQKHELPDDVLDWSLRAVVNLSAQNSANRKRFRDSTLMETIAKRLRNYREPDFNISIASWCMQAVVNIASKDSTGKIMETKSLLDSLLETLDYHGPNIPGLAEVGIRAVSAIAEGYPDSRVTLGYAGVCDVLVRILKAHVTLQSPHVGIAKKLVKAMQSLSQNCEQNTALFRKLKTKKLLLTLIVNNNGIVDTVTQTTAGELAKMFSSRSD